MPTDEVAYPFKNWCQGDFVQLDDQKVPMICGGARPDGRPGLYPLRLEEENYRGYVVISQTCDINRDIEKVPAVLVVPLVATRAYADVLRGRAPRYACVDGAGEGLVADLSTVMSVHKSYISAWNRQVGFSTDDGRQRFARDIERAFGRFAFPDKFNDILTPFVEKIKKNVNKPNKEFGGKLLAVDEIRVSTTSSWEELPVQLSFLVIWSDAATDDAKSAVRETFTKELAGLKWDKDFFLSTDQDIPAIRFGTYDDISSRDYLSSFAIDVTNLSFSSFYQSQTGKS
ncbi:hypothetical protein [Paracoccus salipaludis]|uniref:hypothetical protein n=3 Tax=Paracoccus salipaludis TaxID=2032623 RepID=UPI00197D7C9C|nr:hypothetical protein [Paracoccus salipaludis]